MTAVIHRYDRDAPIAFFGGVYGNVPGLAACLDGAAAQGAELRVFVGDATGCCGHSDQALDLLRANCEVFIADNHEVQAVAGALSCGCGYGSSSAGEDERLSCVAHAFAMATVREDQLAWLALWPETGVIETPIGRVLLCHGSPERNNEFLYESQLDAARLEAWLDLHDARGMVCTHTGLPWRRALSSSRFALNCGAAGKPDHDGDPAVHYALLRQRDGQAQMEIRRVQYDHLTWAAQLADEGVDPLFLWPLKTGWWMVGEGHLPAHERARRTQMTTA